LHSSILIYLYIKYTTVSLKAIKTYLNSLGNKIVTEQPLRFKMVVQSNDPVVGIETVQKKLGLLLERIFYRTITA